MWHVPTCAMWLDWLPSEITLRVSENTLPMTENTLPMSEVSLLQPHPFNSDLYIIIIPFSDKKHSKDG